MAASSSPSNPSPLPTDFLSGPGPQKVVHKVDFKQTALPEYDGLFAVVIDNCLSKEECNELVRAAEATTNGKLWEQAMVNVGNGNQRMIMDVRYCSRIIWDDRDLVAKIWSRVKDCVLPDIEYLKDKPKVTGFGPMKRGEVLQMTRLNERMRFLRYEPGQYFRRTSLLFLLLLFILFSQNPSLNFPFPSPGNGRGQDLKYTYDADGLYNAITAHMDGTFVTPDKSEQSYYTLHLYLSESDPTAPEGPLVGGSTTFHSLSNYVDEYNVEPKIGRVLIFQHRGLLHSGADVSSGIKFTMRTDLMYKVVSKLEK